MQANFSHSIKNANCLEHHDVDLISGFTNKLYFSREEEISQLYKRSAVNIFYFT